MNLLFITQKIDKNDDLLGVYHEWVKRLAKKFEMIYAICLFEGEHDLPSNVKVFSLGKENGLSKIKYLKNFYKYVWQLRKEYDVVFVHMNPEYLVLAGWLWKISGKRVVLWYAHYLSNLKLRFADFFADRILTSVKNAFPYETKKLRVLQQGIDTGLFKPQEVGKKGNIFKILFLGRISPVKDLETLLKATRVLKERGRDFKLSIVGSPTDKDFEYNRKIRGITKQFGLDIFWLDHVSNRETARIYNEHDVFINLTATGSFDKTILEAMSCGMVVIVCNKAYEQIFSPALKTCLLFREKDEMDLADKIEKIAELTPEETAEIKSRLRRFVVDNHDLDNLINKLADVLQSEN